MVSKFTSLNRTALFKTNYFRWASTYLFLIAMVLGGVNNAYAQPTFTQCNDSDLTLQPGGADFELDDITIPAFLSVNAVAGSGTVTYTASPSVLECADINGGRVTVTVIATDDMGSDTCITNVLVMDGGPAARCMDLELPLLGPVGELTVLAADFDNGSSACTSPLTFMISDDGGSSFSSSLTFDCMNLMDPVIDIILQVTDDDMAMATCMTTLTLQDAAPFVSCMDTTIYLDAAGVATLSIPQVDNMMTPSDASACGPGTLMLSRGNFTAMDISSAANPTVAVSLIATNATGQMDSCTANITVLDTIAPVVVCNPIEIELVVDSLDAMGNYTLTAAELATLSMGTVDNDTFTTMVSISTFSCADVGDTVDVTVIVTDPSMNADTCMTTITVRDNTPPVLMDCQMTEININNATGECFAVPNFTNPTFSESCPQMTAPLTVAFTSTDPDMMLPMDGPAAAGATNMTEFPVGQTTVTFTVTDASGLTDNCSFTVTVTDNERPTFASCPPSVIMRNVDNNECDQQVVIQPPVPMDNCGAGGLTPIVLVSHEDNANDVVLNNTAPSGMPGDPAGVDIADFPVGTTTILYGYRDAQGLSTAPMDQCTVQVIIVDNIPPTIICPPGNLTLSFGSCNPGATVVPDYRGLSEADDNCSSNNILTQIPAQGTSINDIAGLTPSDEAPLDVSIIVTDGVNSDTCTFTVLLNDTNQPIPQTVPLPNLSSLCGDLTVDAPTARDGCGNIIFGDPNQGTPAGNNMYLFTPGTYNVEWVYTDATNNTVTTQNQFIQVASDTDGPTFDCSTIITLQLDSMGQAVLSVGPGGFDINNVADSCGVDNTSIRFDGLENLPLNCNNLGSNVVTVSARDNNMFLGSCNDLTVIVEDTINPVLFNVPTGTLSADCSTGADTLGLNVFADDNCGSASITFNTFTTQTDNRNLSTFYNYTVNNTFIATDNRGNQSMQSYRVMVADTNAPTFSSGLATTENLSLGQNCTATANFPLTNMNVSDNCADFGFLDLNFTVRNAGGTVLASGTGNASFDFITAGSYTITYTVQDPSGNTSAPFVRSYTVIDDSAPFVVCDEGPFTIGLPSSGSFTLGGQFIDIIDGGSFDNCGGTAIGREVTRNGLPAVFTCDDVNAGPIEVILTVTDLQNELQNSCRSFIIVEDNIAPQIRCQQNISVTLNANGQASITPEMVFNAANSFDGCTGSIDVSTLSLDIMNFNLDNIGTPVLVTLTGADDNGNTGSCSSLITINPPRTCFQIASQSGGAGDTISVPIIVSEFTNIGTFQFTIDITDTMTANFVGTSNLNPGLGTSGLIGRLIETDSFISNIDTMIVTGSSMADSMVFDTMLGYNYDQLAVSFLSNSFIPRNLMDGDTAFFIDLVLTGNLNTSTRLTENLTTNVTPSEIVYVFNDDMSTPTTIQGVPRINCNGNPTISISQLIVSGTIRTELDEPVNLVEVELFDNRLPGSSTLIDLFETGPDGTYRLLANTPGDYRIAPTKDILVSEDYCNGVNFEDVAIIQRHAVGNVFLDSPYKKIAADVTKDNEISGFDALILGLFRTNLCQGTTPNADSWQFVDADEVLINAPNNIVPNFTSIIDLEGVITDAQNNDFIAVKSGDVGSTRANPQIRTEDDLVFTIKDEALIAGEQYDFNFSAQNFNEVIAYEFLLNFNPAILKYTGTEQLDLDGFAMVGTSLLDQGTLVLGWYNGTPSTRELEDLLFSLSFEVLQDAESIRPLFTITAMESFQPLAYNDFSEANNVRLEIAGNTTTSDYQLYQNTPNPFQSETVIGFDLPVQTTGIINVMDISGRLVKSYTDTYQKGYNQITIPASDLPASGVLYYQLKTTDFTATKKMILID